MTRMIDADAVYKILESCEIRKATIGNPLTDWEYGYTCGIERAESEIECAPTIDAVPVIRCKDCKWWKEYCRVVDGEVSDHICSLKRETDGNMHRAKADDCCSWAERKEE